MTNLRTRGRTIYERSPQNERLAKRALLRLASLDTRVSLQSIPRYVNNLKHERTPGEVAVMWDIQRSGGGGGSDRWGRATEVRQTIPTGTVKGFPPLPCPAGLPEANSQHFPYMLRLSGRYALR